MTSFTDRLKLHLNRATVAEQMIYLNIAVFVLTFLVKAIATLMQWNPKLVFHWFSLPADLPLFYSKPWTLLSYGFLHADFIHILFNSIVLFYFGNLFLNFFSKAQFYHFSPGISKKPVKSFFQILFHCHIESDTKTYFINLMVTFS